MAKIKVIRVKVDEYPEVVTIDDGLESLQSEVGGYIEMFMPFEDDVALIVNEEGKINGLDLNRAVYDEDDGNLLDIIAGNFIIVYAPPMTGEFESLPNDLISKYMDRFYEPEMFLQSADGVLVLKENKETNEEDLPF